MQVDTKCLLQESLADNYSVFVVKHVANMTYSLDTRLSVNTLNKVCTQESTQKFV